MAIKRNIVIFSYTETVHRY